MPKDSVTITGLDEVNKILTTIAPKHAANLARSSIHAIASEMAKEAKKNAPKDQGILKKAIKAKRRKSPPHKPRSEVIIEHGKGVKNDAWYWHFIEYGTIKQGEKPFLTPVYNFYKSNIEQIYTKKFALQLIKKLARMAKK